MLESSDRVTEENDFHNDLISSETPSFQRYVLIIIVRRLNVCAYEWSRPGEADFQFEHSLIARLYAWCMPSRFVFSDHYRSTVNGIFSCATIENSTVPFCIRRFKFLLDKMTRTKSFHFRQSSDCEMISAIIQCRINLFHGRASQRGKCIQLFSIWVNLNRAVTI